MMLFTKGHATGNDFVIIDDHHGALDLRAEQVVWLCDRRRGIGGDGVLRVVRAGNVPDSDADDPAVWFMDYRNADGSVAEMCGNGLRLFSRHLLEQGLVGEAEFVVATRAGLRRVRELPDSTLATDLGEVKVGRAPVTIRHQGRELEGHPADVGNPHAVCFVDGEELDALDLTIAPTWEPAEAFPNGVNVEFIHVVEPGRLRMRVHERGCGETLSCGTGVVAAATVHRLRSGVEGPVRVSVPGGDLTVTFEDGGTWLTGPALVVAEGEFRH
ncbi:diaminopimelate epimerase [Arachnia propionica]|uniref:Diaminopimelate epimerase n=1 Tax=Arachnia propionica TaxID=1750 RepID=A0A3P1WR51_9ACTN|nr:diaminopimelate epimerase [Arachnia propionica]RRD49084.1 diaminopimelate epimerase [Arachnia propionica]